MIMPAPGAPAEATNVEPVQPWLRIFGGTSYAVLASLSITLYIILAFIFAKYNRQYKKSAFFIITWQLIAVDILTQAWQIVFSFPITVTGQLVYGDGMSLHMLAVVDSVAYYATVAFCFLMTVNRATLFFLPRVNSVIFEAPGIYGTLAATWLVALSAPISLTLSECWKTFLVDGVYSYKDCVAPTGKQVYQVWYNIKTYCPIAMLATYFAVFAYLHYLTRARGSGFISTSREKSTRKREMRLLIQSVLICGCLEFENLAFTYLKYLHPEGQLAYAFNYFQNWIKIVNSTMTATILFSFNAEIRRRFVRILRPTQMISSVQGFTQSRIPSQTGAGVTKVTKVKPSRF